MFKTPKIHTHAEIGSMNIMDYILTKPLCEVNRNRMEIRTLNKSWQLRNSTGEPVINDGIATQLALREFNPNSFRDNPVVLDQVSIDYQGMLLVSRPGLFGNFVWRRQSELT
jgi:hypothetical protein